MSFVVLVFFASQASAANIYNFHFSDKSSKTVETEEEDEERPAPDPPQQPVIINNYNNNDNANKQANGALATPPATVEVSAHETAPPESIKLPLRWKFGTGYFEEHDRGGSAIVLGLDYAPSVSTEVELYGGVFAEGILGLHVNEFLGIDLIHYPVLIPFNNKYDMLKFGVIVGGSTLAARSNRGSTFTPTRDNIGSIHIGARAILSGLEQFAFFLQAKANLGNVQTEIGFISPF